VLFNRFYQPDFDPKTLTVKSYIQLSTSHDQRLPLHWIAILSRHIKADLAGSSDVHTAEDVVKLLMVGANVTMIASALLQ
jgi:dihydroorotate dehydrogenase (fumarate)